MTAVRVIGVDAITDQQIALFHTKTEPTGDCVVWLGEIDKDGYGRLSTRHGGRLRKRWNAHRFAYALMVGPIPPGHEVDHRCRNRACVLPDHLEAVTQKVNHDRWVEMVTHCPAGHEYSEANTHWKGNSRSCRTCARDYGRRYRLAHPERHREAARAYRARQRAAHRVAA